MKKVYKCLNCQSIYNSSFDFCGKCLKYDEVIEIIVEQQKRTDDMTYVEFIKLAEPVPSYESDKYIEYMWDNPIKYKEMFDNKGDLYVYTVIDAENRLWIHNGVRWVNRMGYLFAKNYVEIDEGIEY